MTSKKIDREIESAKQSEKKPYKQPRLTSHGNVEKLTQHHGENEGTSHVLED